MSTRALVILACILPTLAGCGKPHTDAMDCTSYGYRPGTPVFSACLERAALVRKNAEAAGDAQIRAMNSARAVEWGQRMMRGY